MADLVEAVAIYMHEAWRNRSGLRDETHSWPDLSEDDWEEGLANARAALSAIEAKGYRVVPVEPTEAMVHASTMTVPTWDDDASRRKWAAMLKAAPKVTP